MIEFVAWYERISVITQNIWETIKQETRTWLGPAPVQLVLLADGRILPATIQLPSAVQDTAFLFDATTNRIRKLGPDGVAEGRFRRLPYVSLRVEHPSLGSIDLSDWVGGLRANPVPASLSIQQLILLASLSLHRYIPISGATVHITNDEGEERVEEFP